MACRPFVIILVLAVLSALALSCGPALPDPAGLWEGPHPEIQDVKFLFSIQPSADGGFTGRGCWVNNGFFQYPITLDSVRFWDDSIAVRIDDWGDRYVGRLSPDGQAIDGGFVGQDGTTDAVPLRRVNPLDYRAILPLHLDTAGRYQPSHRLPPNLGDGLVPATPASAGLDAAVLDSLVTALAQGRYGRTHAFLVLKEGRLVSESYFYGLDRDDLHPLESATKSVTALLVGAAVDRGLISGVEVPVQNDFPQYASAFIGSKPSLTLAHLLTMTAGMALDDEGRRQAEDMMGFLLARPQVQVPGAGFIYDGGATELLGGVIRSVTGQYADAWAEEVLFKPLGIAGWDWSSMRQNGYPLCSGTLWLRPRDMAKIGQLVLDCGRWQGEQVISRAWIDQATRRRVETGIDGDGYGYQWWVSDLKSGGHSFPMVWANGMGGQFILIFPDHGLVLVFTGGNWEGGNEGRSWDVFQLLRDRLAALLMPG